MIKRMGLFQKRDDFTQSQFSAYWTKKHSPIVMQMPRFSHYTQNHCVDLMPCFTPNHPAYVLSGIAEMYWATEANMLEDFNSHDHINCLRQDECEFMSNISVCIVDESALLGEKSQIKLMLCVSKSDTAEDFKFQDIQQALPHLQGLQFSETLQVINRPQLAAIQDIPEHFYSLWFNQYQDVLTDFSNSGWQQFYTTHFQKVSRISILMLHSIDIRKDK